jgi:GNAT superfamily N-acetyltransferase
MHHFLRTDPKNPDYQKLEIELDHYLKKVDGEDHAFFAQFNKSDSIQNIIVCYVGTEAVGCGAFKKYDAGTVEIKRMFVLPAYRNTGIASAILNELEQWAQLLGFTAAILETGIEMTNAQQLYYKKGYLKIPNYGQYTDVKSSVCMKKELT